MPVPLYHSAGIQVGLGLEECKQVSFKSVSGTSITVDGLLQNELLYRNSFLHRHNLRVVLNGNIRYTEKV